MKELTKSATAVIRRFFVSEPGRDLLLFLRDKIPSIPRGSLHEIAFDAGRVEGYKQALEDINELVYTNEKAEQDLENPGLK